jgi:uncharacterized protein (TIGR02569 family)
MATQSLPTSVLAAFGVAGMPVPLEGGQGTSWRVGDAVLKPLDLPESELAWQADVFASISADGVRVAQPLRTQEGSLVVEGWCAWEWVDGRHERRRWPEIIAAGERFHAALVDVPCPDFIARRSDPWAIGDRVAWGDLPLATVADVKHVVRLASVLRPIAAASQLIHGDLTGNVLFDDHLPPSVIDFSPYCRPTAFASAIVVADAFVWEGAQEDVLAAVSHIEDFPQHLLRALIYRTVADRLLRPGEPERPDACDPYHQAVEWALRLAS